MKNVLNFDDFIFDKLFENKKEMCVILSDRLYDLLLGIENHPVAEKLLRLNEEEYKSDKVAFIDYDVMNYGNFTYIIPNKVFDYIKKNYYFTDDVINDIYKMDMNDTVQLGNYYSDLWKKSRVSTSINKVVNKLFPGKFKPSGIPGEDLESFKNLVITERKKLDDIFNKLKIVEGDDIIKYYKEENYYNSDSTPLGQSCMRYSKCSDYLKFYSENKGVKMVVLFSTKEPEKITGRALLWDIEYINNQKANRKFMDRIYTVYDSDKDLFIEYAVKNGWLYKERQGMYLDIPIIDPLNNTNEILSLKTTKTFDDKDYYPYLDTLIYFYYNENDKFLSNKNTYGDQFKVLQNIDGTYVGQQDDYDTDEEYYGDNYIYVHFYGEEFHQDELIYCEFGDEYRLPNDATWLDDFQVYATQQYIDSELEFSVPLDSYIYKDIAVRSRYYDSEFIPKDESHLVYEERAARLDFDEIYENDAYRDYMLERDIEKNEYIEYYLKPYMYFHYKDRKYFILCKTLNSLGGLEVWAHKEWDKESIFEVNGVYYLDDVGNPNIKEKFIKNLKYKK